MNVVEIENVSKSFGPVAAVQDLSLAVPAGTIYGFIGPNGSGKSTTLRMIMRIYHPDPGSGPLRVLGQTSFKAANGRVGYLPEERGLYRKMRVREILRFYAELKGCRDIKPRVNAWLERLGASDWADKKVEALSKGMAQKIQFIAAVIADPDLVIMDEPFSGLDPVNMDVLRQAVLDLKRRGSTVILSTHDMKVAESICDFICMIYKGRKVLDGTLESIQERYGQDTIMVSLDGNSHDPEGIEGVVRGTDFGRFQELRLAGDADPQAILQELMRRGRVLHFELTRPSLHDIFVRIAGPRESEGPDA